MSKRNEPILTIIMCAAMLSGCASLVSGSTQEVSFQSNPEDVVVTVSGRVIGKTPVTVQLDKKTGQSVVFGKDGYKPVTMQLTTTMDSWFWGNILLGGLIGSTTDGLSGAVHEYSPSQYFVTLSPVGVNTMESSTLTTQRDKAKEFIVRHYASLIADISKGGGDDFSGLMPLLNIGEEQQADAVSKLRALSKVYTDAPEFADRVTALYLK